ncbi:high affinity immunoglobulin gamma Fc receptor I-like isoform X2 [Eleutherodactylus coqui]
MVTFNPDWNKIFKGESVNMTCDVDPTAEEDVTYHWFKDSNYVDSGKTYSISSAQPSHSGNYQCQSSSGDKSDPVRLEVYNGYVILQAPPYVYEGDNLTLRCHHYPGYPAGQTIFYKNAVVIKNWGPEDELHIKNVDVTSSSKYKCSKKVKHHLIYYTHTDEISVSVQELFSIPTITVKPLSVTEGDHMTLTCHTKLSLLRLTTVLQFAFYQDGRNIQEFGSSNNYDIPSATLKDSGDYKCEVKTSNPIMKKMSAAFTIQVRKNSEHDKGTSHFATIVSVISLVFILVLAGVYGTRNFLPYNIYQPLKAVSEESDDKTENICVDLDTSNRWQGSSQNPHKANYLVTEEYFIV